MKKVIRLTESDLTRIVKRVIAEGAVEDLSKKIKMSTNKFPGEKSLKYCARKMGTKKEFQTFLLSCGAFILNPLIGGFTCAADAATHVDDIVKITGCVISCIDTGMYGGQKCQA
jgi:hypothetical protein